MRSRLVALTARRAALQAECALQRDDAVQAGRGDRLRRRDGSIASSRSFAA